MMSSEDTQKIPVWSSHGAGGCFRQVDAAANQAPLTGGVANGHLVKRWTNEELLQTGQVVDQALIAAPCSEKGDEAVAERAEGYCLGAHWAPNEKATKKHKFLIKSQLFNNVISFGRKIAT